MFDLNVLWVKCPFNKTIDPGLEIKCLVNFLLHFLIITIPHFIRQILREKRWIPDKKYFVDPWTGLSLLGKVRVLRGDLSKTSPYMINEKYFYTYSYTGCPSILWAEFCGIQENDHKIYQMWFEGWEIAKNERKKSGPPVQYWLHCTAVNNVQF